MPRVKVYAGTPETVPQVRALQKAAFGNYRYKPRVELTFNARYDLCDEDYRDAHYRYRRLRGKPVSALRVFVRRIQHPQGPIPVTIIGGVCTAEKYRGRGLIKPVIEDSLEYSRQLGAQAQLIVTPRKNYYQRHGYRYVITPSFSGALPDVPLDGARVAPLEYTDAAWMTELFDAQNLPYGPLHRSETYTREWVLGMRLMRLERHGFKLLRRGNPVAYLIYGDGGKGTADVADCCSRSRSGEDEMRLLSFVRHLNLRRFSFHACDAHPLISALRASGHRLKRTTRESYMYYPLGPGFPIPDETFCYSWLDSV